MCLYCLLRLPLEDFVTHVHQLAEPPPLIGLAWALATSAHAWVLARVAVQHPPSGRPIMAQTKQAEAKGGLLNPGDSHGPSATIQPRRLQHRRLHLLVAQPCGHRPEIVALLEQKRRNAVPNGMTTDACGEPGRTTGPAHGLWQSTFMGVMPADDSLSVGLSTTGRWETRMATTRCVRTASMSARPIAVGCRVS